MFWMVYTPQFKIWTGPPHVLAWWLSQLMLSPQPGSLSVNSANITSLKAHHQYVLSWQHDAIALEEVRLTAAGKRMMTGLVHERGWDFFWVPHCQLVMVVDGVHLLEVGFSIRRGLSVHDGSWNQRM